MSNNVKNVVLKKKIEGVIYELMVKTSAGLVSYGDSNVKTKIDEIVQNITNLTSGKADANAVVTAITSSSANGKVTYTKNGTNTDVTIKGVVVAPTYAEETRTLILPVTKADGTTENVVMALGKDLVVKSGSLDAKKENIVLVLSNDDEIKIPVKSLVDIYTGETTSSAVVSVDSNNKITAQVRVSSKAGNALSVVEEEGKEGLYVNVPTVDLSGKVDKETGKELIETTKIQKLDGIEEGAEVNVIETVKVNGTALTPDANKAVDVAVPRIIVSNTEPADLTTNDLWCEDITE